MKKNGAEELSHTIPVVHRTIRIAQVIAKASSKRDISPKSLAAETGIPIVTCYRILRTLTAHDWIRTIPGGGYEMSSGFSSLAGKNSALEQVVLQVRPELIRLSQRTLLTAKISIRSGDFAVTLCRNNSPRETSISIREGAQFHLTYGSSGAVLLSQLTTDEMGGILDRAPKECWRYQSRKDIMKRLRDIHKNGCCIDVGTYNPGYYGFSVPLVLRKPVFRASLTVVGFPDDFPSTRLAKLKKEMGESIRNITKILSILPAQVIA